MMCNDYPVTCHHTVTCNNCRFESPIAAQWSQVNCDSIVTSDTLQDNQGAI